jgi:6-phosphogluconolactonase
MEQQQMCVYVTVSGEDRVARFRLDSTSGTLTHAENFALSGGPGPLVLSPDGGTLYVSRRGDSTLSSLCIEPHSGRLLKESGAVLEPSNAVYISVDPAGRHLFSCDNGSGRVSAHRLGEDGGLVTGRPAVANLTSAKGAHSVTADQTGRYVFVSTVGWDGYPLVAAGGTPAERAAAKATYDKSDAIYQYCFDSQTGELTPNDPPVVHYEQMARGPRHLCLHPSLAVAYTTDEMSSTVTVLWLDGAAGTLQLRQSVSTMPEGGRWVDPLNAADFAAPERVNDGVLQQQLEALQRDREADEDPNSTAQLRLHPSGRFLFVPNRGHDSIACFAVSPGDGRLSLIERVPTEPHTRGMDIDPTGQFVLTAGVHSGAVSVYRMHPTTGRLRFVSRHNVGKAPMWVLVAPFSTAEPTATL